jgi:diphthamide synthase (EF-2-diphthine--ammonia ligase)
VSFSAISFFKTSAPIARRNTQAHLVCVDLKKLSKADAGRALNVQLLEDLPEAIDPCGENGEFHTCVHAGPIFVGAIALERGERVLRDGRFQYVDLIEVGAA